jgi:hypothetical protein
LFSKIEGDDNTKYDTQIETLIETLRDTVAHEPALCSILDEFSDKISANTAALTIDRRVRDQVGGVYEFLAVDETETASDLPGNYLDVLNIGLAHIGYALAMARVSNVTKDDLEYLTAKVEDALSGNYNGRYLHFRVPTKAETQKALEASSLLPAVEMAQRVLSIEVPAVPRNPKQVEFLIEQKRQLLARHREVIEAYDPQIEARFQAEADAQLEIERRRLYDFKTEGKVDPAVVVSPLFSHYEDQILLNIQQLEGKKQNGSSERWYFEKAQAEFEALTIEIAALEETLAPLNARVDARVGAPDQDGEDKA